MNIGYVCSSEERKTDAVLGVVAEEAKRDGILLAGTIQPVDPDAPHEKCNIVLGLLPDGARRNISLDLGPGATGCRLDAAALEEAVMIVHDRLPRADGLIVNKFGKQEAIGRGLVAAIIEACDRGIPVLVGVSPQWREAFLAFADGRAEELPASSTQVLGWLRQARHREDARH
jgi:predicted transcriptional regulator